MVNLDDAKQKLREWASTTPPVRLVVIYGSYAKGTARPDSDLDIGIAIDAAEGDTDAFTTWIHESAHWRADLAQLLAFDKVHLEWLDSSAPTPLSGAREAHIIVFRRR